LCFSAEEIDILSLFNQNIRIKTSNFEKISYICSELVDILSELTF
jgi:hypothetical protein